MKAKSPMAARDQEDGPTNWVMISLVVATVIVALYGPLLWELAHG